MSNATWFPMTRGIHSPLLSFSFSLEYYHEASCYSSPRTLLRSNLACLNYWWVNSLCKSCLAYTFLSRSFHNLLVELYFCYLHNFRDNSPIGSLRFSARKKSVKKNREIFFPRIFFPRNRNFFWPIPLPFERRLRIQSFIQIGPPISEKSVPTHRQTNRQTFFIIRIRVVTESRRLL